MSENNTNLTVEEKLKAALSGETLNNALDFVAHLRAIGMTCEDTRFFYNGLFTCIIIPFEDSGKWMICDCPTEEREGFPLDESAKTFALANIKKCDMCGGGGCGHENMNANKTIFGQYIEGLCSSECHFYDPDAEALVQIKKLMDYWKLMIDEDTRGDE